MSEIRAIETVYKGYRFRSRLEARWAVFFDHCSIGWEYEKEGFVLQDGTSYLPDFWVPLEGYPMGSGYWLEIKGATPSDAEKEKCRLLALGTGHVVYLVAGPPGEHLYWKWYRDGRLTYDGCSSTADDGYEPELHFWCTAARDGAHHVDDGVRAARSARFEHGGRP